MDIIKFTIPGKPEYISMVRLAVGSIASTNGFDLDTVEDVKTAVSEACKNISCHGFSGFADHYDVECRVGEDSIEVSVQEDCDDHTIEKMSPPCRQCPQEGNLGVYVIESLMTDVKVISGANGLRCIQMRKTR